MTSLHPASHLHQCLLVALFFFPAYLYRHHLPSPVFPHQVMHVQSVARVPVCASCGLTSESAVPTHHRRSTHIIHVYQLVSTCTCMSCSGDSPGNVQHPGGELILTDYLHTSPTKNYFFPLIRAPPITVLPDHARPVFLHSLTTCLRYLTHPYRTCACPCPTCHSIVSSVPCPRPLQMLIIVVLLPVVFSI